MRKPSLIRFISLVFLAQAVFFSSSPSSYATDPVDVTSDQSAKAGSEAFRKGDFDKAIESFNKALSLDPKNFNAYNGLGNVYARKGDVDKAIESFNKALSLNANEPSAHIGLGNLYFRKGDTPKAIESFEKVLSTYPRNAEALFSLGAVYVTLKQKDAALKQYQLLSGIDKKLAEELNKQIQSS